MRGEIDMLMGYNNPYVPPHNPDLTANSQDQSPSELADKIINYLIENRKVLLW